MYLYICIYTYIYVYIYNIYIYIYIYIHRYRKIPLTRPGRIYGQRTNLMGLYSGVGSLYTGGGRRGEAYNREKKHFNLQPVKLTFLSFFSNIKHVFWHFSRHAKCEICSKLTIKTPEYVNLTIKLKIKTPLTSFWPREHISLLVTVFLLLTLIS